MVDQTSKNTLRFALIAYLATCALVVIFSFVPGGRVWGLNLLAFFPSVVRYSAIPFILIAPFVAIFVARHIADDESSDILCQSRKSLWYGVAFLAGCGASFYLFRATTQFGGDGYAVISNLASARPLVKYRNFGAIEVEFALYALLGKGGKETALLVFQLISYASGVLFTTLMLLTSAVLFNKPYKRVLFVVGMVAGGYALLFFGYAENYPLFVVSVALFLYVGILAVKRSVSRWLVLPANLLALSIHIFGLMLLPASLFLLVRKSDLSRWFDKRPLILRGLVLLVPVAFVLSCFFYFFYTNYFFRFAFLPMVPDRFTVNGYTIFSEKHLLDVINLVLMLCPGILVLITSLLRPGSRHHFRDDTVVFLTISLLCTLTTVMVFDPKLGMARDWDLFGFVGVPLNLLLFTLVLQSNGGFRHTAIAVLLAVTLGGLFLSARVAIRRNQNVAIERLHSFTTLYPVRNNKSALAISKFYFDQGDSSRGLQEENVWKQSDTSILLTYYGKELYDLGHLPEAMRQYRLAVANNPFQSIPYNNIGQLFMRSHQLDSAEYYLRIAEGLNPENQVNKCNLGWVAFEKGHFGLAEKYWLNAVDLDPTFISPQLYLLELYKKQNNLAKYLERLPKVAEYPDAPAILLVEATLNYYQQRLFDDARRLWTRAVNLGLDSAQIDQTLRQYPKLRQTR